MKTSLVVVIMLGVVRGEIFFPGEERQTTIHPKFANINRGDESPGTEPENLGNESENPGIESENPESESLNPENEYEDPGNESENPGNKSENPRNESENPPERIPSVSNSGGDIVFANETKNVEDPATSVNISDCTVTNICNNITDYPSFAINRALERLNKHTKSILKSLAKSEPSISIRIKGDDALDANVCATKRERIFPRGALNMDGEFKWILNSPDGKEEYVQSVDTTVCLDADEECLGGQFYSHSTYCKQEYSEHKLLALSEDAEEIIIDNFRFPSCCSCQVSRKFEF